MSRGAQRRARRQFREALLAATPQERTELTRLSVLVRTGHVSIPEASDMLRGLLRSQNERP